MDGCRYGYMVSVDEGGKDVCACMHVSLSLCVCVCELDGWMDGWMDGWRRRGWQVPRLAFSSGHADNSSGQVLPREGGRRRHTWARQMTVTYYGAPLFICLLFFLQSGQTSNIRIPKRTGVMSDLSGALPFPAPIPTLPKKPSSCFGLPSATCQNTQDMADAGDAQTECKKMFCDPLCLRDTWKCEIHASNFKEALTPAVTRALCAQFLAHGCSTVMQCCDPLDPMLFRYTEAAFYGGQGLPQTAMNIGTCAHDPAIKEQADMVCTACRADVTVSFQLLDDRCGNLMSSKPLESKENERDLFHAEEDHFQVNRVLEPYLLKPLGVAGTHRTLRERCRALQAKVAGMLAVMVPIANEKICNCLGCCTDKDAKQCFFPEMQAT